MESIIEKIKKWGFEHVRVNSPYAPLKLECIAAYPKKTIGKSETGRLTFLQGEHPTLYCMYGRDFFGEYHLFYNDKAETPCYKLIQGHFQFVFDAEQFFQLLQNASRKNWRNFIGQTILKNPAELAKFKNLITTSSCLSDKQRNRGLGLIKELEQSAQ